VTEPGSTPDPSRADQVAPALLAWLRDEFGNHSLAFREPPERLAGGNRTFVYAFRLKGGDAELSQPLVVRILRPGESATRLHWEADLHTTLAEADYPVPAILHTSTRTGPLGGAFQIVERVVGRRLIDEPGEALPVTRVLYEAGSGLFGRWPGLLADLHARLHALDPEPVRRVLERAGALPERWGVDPLLTDLGRRVEQLELERLEPGLDWLRSHPPRPETPVVCHGDFFPNQVFTRDGVIAGVIDWSELRLAEPALDVGTVKAGIETVPISLPPGLRALARRLQRRVVQRYVDAYRRIRPLPWPSIHYYEALRCLQSLTWSAEQVQARELERYLEAGSDPYGSPLGIAALTRHFRAISGLDLRG
jgi:aminoglycoside phosphotransferase (APT) family kinase protein